MGGSDQDEGLAVGRVILIIFRESAIIGKPAEGSFHNPALGQDFESVQGGALDHLQAQAAAGKPCLQPAAECVTSVASIHPDESQPTEGCRQFLEHQARSVAVLNIGGMNDHRQNQTKRVHQEMSFSSHDLLACIVAAHSSVIRYLNALAVEDRSGRGFFFPLLSRTASRKES